ncbi:conserved domain protein [Limosilactobacillus oris F0423]|uniref:Conserved domain protein n=3 Tax=Limosilactobacillus oris TaxID=1632 RepID=A0ABP2LCA2_9LACO|nr:conserved domain protein [Limosilactobacillus oris F0423]
MYFILGIIIGSFTYAFKKEAGKKLPALRKKPDDESKIDSSSGFMYTQEIVPDIM